MAGGGGQQERAAAGEHRLCTASLAGLRFTPVVCVLQPAPLPNSGEALSLPLFVHAHAGIPPDARLVLRLVAWSAVEVRRCRLKLADMKCRELS